MNNVNLYGHLGADPELRYTPSGKAVCEFRLAVNSGFGEKKETEWVNVETWDKTAEKVADAARRGSEIAIINGRMKTETWEKPPGTKHWKTKVVANTVVVGVKGEAEGSFAERPIQRPKPVPVQAEMEIDEIPF